MIATRIFTRVVLMGLPAVARPGRVPVPAVGAADGNGSGTRRAPPAPDIHASSASRRFGTGTCRGTAR